MDEEVIKDIVDEISIYSKVILSIEKYDESDCKALAIKIFNIIQDNMKRENNKFKIL